MGSFCACAKSLSKQTSVMPVETAFTLPSPLPSWPPGNGFANGTVNLGGLEVSKVTTFTKVWSAQEGGEDGLGATFFRPSSIPTGFSLLGCYAQPNGRPQFGWSLVGRDVSGAGTLAKPVDYTLLWSSESVGIRQEGHGYFWLPVAPDGYRAVGLLVTASPEKPSTDDVRCVRDDLTDDSEKDGWVWGSNGGFDVYGLRPTSRGVGSPGVCVGTFAAAAATADHPSIGTASPPLPLYCLKNRDFETFSSMPNLDQIKSLVQAYSPVICLHPDESFLPSSVNWFFSGGALLYQKDSPTSSPSPVSQDGSNLPQGGSNDGAYWLDLPQDAATRDRVQKGDLHGCVAYLHVKPMLGATFTDLAMWVFYPFNGCAKAKVGLVNIPLGRIGEHVGDWEHVTLRVSNFTGELRRVYLSQHSSGKWKDAADQVEFYSGSNKPVVYSSLRGHAMYFEPGLVLQGNSKLGVGIRNDTAKGGATMDVGERCEIVAVEHLGGGILVAEPPWLNFMREWGPKVTYDTGKELKKLLRFLPGKLRSELVRIVDGLPAEVLGQEGPTGPKNKDYWSGDER